MSFNGWVTVHRKILDHWVSQEPELFAFWMRLLIEANHSDKKRMFNGTLIEIKRGQTLFGLEAFEAKSGISRKKLRRYLAMLESESMIGRQKTNKYSLISIVNYEEYQLEGSQRASQGQAEGKPRASQGQHIENVNNVENEKNTDYVELKPDIVSEVIEYLNQKAGRNYRKSPTHSKHINARLAEGAKMEDFKAVIDRKCAEWKGDQKFDQYLRPATLFNAEKFNNYLGQLSSPIPVNEKNQGRHVGFEDRDYSKGIIEGVSDDEANF